MKNPMHVVREQWSTYMDAYEAALSGHQHGPRALARDSRQQQIGTQSDGFQPADRGWKI
jgi:hypothetical protein